MPDGAQAVARVSHTMRWSLMRRPSVVLPIPGPGWAYFLDLDGTLIELAESPAAVELGAGLPALVENLRRSSGGALAFISGRSLDDLDRLFPGREYPAAGQHGFERRDAEGRRFTLPTSSRGRAQARRHLSRVVRG